MGRQESLAALALGRGHCEDEVLQPFVNNDASKNNPHVQQYNERGYPRNPETKRRERDNVRAANEVMLVTGIVEDSVAAKEKAEQYQAERLHESYIGLKLMDACRTTLTVGTWGVGGLRRRMLLYRPYSVMGIFEILRRERQQSSVATIAFAGLPSRIGSLCSLGLVDFSLALLEVIEGDHRYLGSMIGFSIKCGHQYLTYHLRVFAILQQLGLISARRLFPSLKSFILFSSESPFQLPLKPSFSRSWLTRFCWMLTPLAASYMYTKAFTFFTHLLFRPIYKSIPRPTGESMFDPYVRPTVQTAREANTRSNSGAQDDSFYEDTTQRGPDNRPVPVDEGRPRPDRDDSSEEEDEEMAHATLISFDVQPTEDTESSVGPWSAELRSANEAKAPDNVQYRVTGLTMLPAITATECLTSLGADILSIPFEAIMVLVSATAYRESIGLGTGDFRSIGPVVPGLGNILMAVSMEMAITGVIWAGFTVGSQAWLARHRLREWALNIDEHIRDRSSQLRSYHQRWWALFVWKLQVLIT